MTQLTDVFLNDVVLCGLVANVLDYITETVTEYNTYTPTQTCFNNVRWADGDIGCIW